MSVVLETLERGGNVKGEALEGGEMRGEKEDREEKASSN